MYSIASYGEMLADETRVQAYATALRATLRPGCVVLEIGTGLGFFALLAARWGAGKVYAVERGDAVATARTLAEHNRLADRIELLQASSSDVSLPERADVVISDLRGVLPFLGDHLPSIADARERHLKPDGILIPQRDDLRAAIVEAPDLYRRKVVAGFAQDRFGIDLGPARRLACNQWHPIWLDADHLLTESRTWARIDYRTLNEDSARGRIELEVMRRGTAHGILVWFDAVLHDGIGFSNAPGQPQLIYKQAFFPLAEPLPVREGEGFAVELEARRSSGRYVWRWSTAFRDASGSSRSFDQSTFYGQPLSPRRLRKRALSYRPRLDDGGEALRHALGRMDGETSIECLAEELAERFPQRFRSLQEALDFACDCSERYG